MVKRMLMDATHPEETRVVVLDGTRLEEFDVETSTKKQIKGNIYLAKVVRVEPSLQAAFVDYGGNRHGFLAFSEIHPDYYQIPVADRERLMAEVERQEEEDRNNAQERQERADHQPQEPQEHQEPPAEAPNTGDAAIDEHPDDHASGEMPLAFAPPAITDTLPAHDADQEHHDLDGPEVHHDHDQTAAGENPPHDGPELHHDHDQTVAGESPPPADDAPPPAEPPPEVVGGEPRSDAEGSESTPTPEEAVSTQPSGEVAIPPTPERQQKSDDKAAGIETVGGDDDDDDEGGAVDNQRRRFLAARHYKIQEVIKRRQIMLVQVVKEERGSKGAALTTFLSLAGRYCVLMPNSARGGGVSHKITSAQDRRRLKTILGDLELTKNMGVILRTAGAERNKAEIKRDYEYLQRTWNAIREVTMTSRAPALVHEEASLIKRAIRDIYSRDIEEVWVDGEEGYKVAKDFMKMLTPSHAKKVQRYKDDIIPLFHRYQVETQMESINSPVVQLRSGGSIVFGQTEALVAIDVNSGRATKERHIEETAYKTNLEAADEIARQLRLRDLAGLIVIDFIDMEENRNNHAVERRLKEALKADRARIQVGRISHFGLLELSRQRLRPSLIEANFRVCNHCAGTGMVRSTESAAVHSLRMLEEEGVRRRSSEVTITVHPDVALYLLNYKREALAGVELRYGLKIFVLGDPLLIPPNSRIDRVKALLRGPDDAPEALPVRIEPLPQIAHAAEAEPDEEEEEHTATRPSQDGPRESGREGGRKGGRDSGGEEDADGRKRRRRRRGGRKPESPSVGAPAPEGASQPAAMATHAPSPASGEAAPEGPHDDTQDPVPSRQGGNDAGGPPRDERGRRRRRGRRGGRKRNRQGEPGSQAAKVGDPNSPPAASANEPQREGDAAPEPATFDHTPAPVAHDPVSQRQDDPAPPVAEPVAAGGNGPSRFFRAIKENVPWRRTETTGETPDPAPHNLSAAPPAPTSEAGSGGGADQNAAGKDSRKGWWQQDTKE